MRETSTVSAPSVLVAAASHVGPVRLTNEDRVYADPDRGAFAVIDGVGGQAAGEFAAQTALETIRQRLQIQIGTPAERVREAIALANDHIHQEALAHPDRRGMACVLTVVLLQNGMLTAGHVGDTRLYKMRGGLLRKLTHDHSPIGEREDSGELSESEAMRHPRRNEVYREVGTEPRAPNDAGFIEVVEETFEPDAALLLCSDGLSDALSGAAIAATIERHAGDPARVADDLIERANDASGKDNVSIVYIEGTAFARDVGRPARSSGAASTSAYAPPSASPPSASPPSASPPLASQSPASSSSASPQPRDPAAELAAMIRTGATGAAAAGAKDAATSPKTSAAARRGTASNAAGAWTDDARTEASQTEHGETGRLQTDRSQADGGVHAKKAQANRVQPDGVVRETTAPHRVLAFVVGMLVGLAIALGVAYAMRDILFPGTGVPTPGPRVLTVGTPSPDPGAILPGAASASGAASAAPSATAPRTDGVASNTLLPALSFVTIGDALAQARPGDTVRVGPGEYREQLVINDGVMVIASPAREAIVRAPAQTTQPWTAVMVTGGSQGVRVSGLKIAGDAQSPIAIGVSVLGRATLEDLDVSGTSAAGIAFDGGTLSLAASVVHANAGPGLTLKGGDARLVHNVFARNSGAPGNAGAVPAPGAGGARPSRPGPGASGSGSGSGTGAANGGADIVLTDTPRVTFIGNVIGGDPGQRIRGLASDQVARFRDTNIVLPPAPRAAAPRRSTPR